jgi:hypothetical protein
MVNYLGSLSLFVLLALQCIPSEQGHSSTFYWPENSVDSNCLKSVEKAIDGKYPGHFYAFEGIESSSNSTVLKYYFRPDCINHPAKCNHDDYITVITDSACKVKDIGPSLLLWKNGGGAQ